MILPALTLGESAVPMFVSGSFQMPRLTKLKADALNSKARSWSMANLLASDKCCLRGWVAEGRVGSGAAAKSEVGWMAEGAGIEPEVGGGIADGRIDAIHGVDAKSLDHAARIVEHGMEGEGFSGGDRTDAGNRPARDDPAAPVLKAEPGLADSEGEFVHIAQRKPYRVVPGGDTPLE